MTSAAKQPAPRTPGYDVAAVRADFPILSELVHGRPLVYLDNAATTQKPRAVLDALMRYYTHDNANIHRGVHTLSERATLAHERARVKLQQFLGAAAPEEIIFTRNATEAINLVARTYGAEHVSEGDEVVISAMEHHSNIVPWQQLCEAKGATLRVIPMDDSGTLLLDEYEKLLTGRTRLVAVTHMSNALGTINPIREIVEMAHLRGIPVLVDGAQAAYHRKVDVQALGCDFYAVSGHKLYGPTGIGALYGRRELLEGMPPFLGGGDMISSVSFEKTLYNALPYKFEAGTPDISGAIGLGAALDYITELGMERIAAHEAGLLEYGAGLLRDMPGVEIIGTAKAKASILSFTLGDIHPHDAGTVLDMEGIAVRTGHHCAQPVMQRFGIPATIRASLACYNTRDELDALASGLRRVQEVFR